MCKKLIYLALLAFVLGSVWTSLAHAAHPNPVAWWKFDGDALDSSGNGHHGTLMGDPGFVQGVFGQALDTTISGDDPEYVVITGYKGILGGNPFSITAWINTSDSSGTFMGWGSTAGGTTRFEFRPDADELRAESSGNVQGLTTLPNNEWIHIAVTVKENAIISEPDVTLYLNGQVDNDPSTGGGASLEMEAGNDVTIARRHTSGRWFDALIDDVRLYDVELTQKQVQEAMAGIGPISLSALDPRPDNEVTDVPREVVLSWTPGEFAPATNGHKVYFSENFSDVNDGIGGITQDANSYTPPQRLDFGTTYYWRVDEVNGPPDYTVYEGDLWSFTTEPFAYAVENVTATASSGEPSRGPENTVNSSGLDESGLLHDKVGDGSMWLSSPAGPQPTWIEFQFDGVYNLHEMWVWNSNESMEPVIGFGFKEVSIEYSVNGTDYTTLGTTAEFARGPGTPDYAHNTTVDFSGVGAKYVRLTANSNWGGILPQYGLSEVRFLYIPVLAREPYPADGATDVSIGTIDEPIDIILGWRTGRGAAKHDVYFGDSWQAVAKGTAPVTSVTETSYGPLALDLGKTYFWRVDEVNEAETPPTWQGDIWNFSTQGYFVVDDFESYNDLDPMDPNSDRIFLKWLDGYLQPTNGSIVGYEVPPFAERSIVNSGSQSMPYFYDNSSGYSEATITLSSQRDWTKGGVKALSLWFRGYPASISSFTEEPAGVYRLAARSVGNISGGDSDEFHFAYQQLIGAGSIIARVDYLRDADDNAQAAVMIRDTLDPDSAHAAVLLESNDIAADADLRFRRRATRAADSTTTTVDGPMAPQWLKLERDATGNITGSYSADGVTWTDIGGEVITMSAPAYIGLAVASEDAGVTCEAQFSNVQITGAGGQWANQDIGILVNVPEPMYVAIANSSGTPAVVYYEDPDDPNATPTQVDAWTQWDIDLNAFADQGVNLANVDTISIGFGDKNNPQPGGSGTMFFDDIWLYPARCMAELLKPAADLNDDCVVDYLELEMAAVDWLKSDSLVAIPSVAPDSAGLMLHYKFDGNADDSSGNNYHGIEMDGPTYVEGKFGQAIHLDGFDDYVAIQDMNYVGVGYPEVTVAAWVCTSDTAGMICTFDRNENWRFEIGGNASGGPGLVGWHLWTGSQIDSGLAPEFPDNTGRVDDGQWHHVAGVFDNGTMIIYIDGSAEEPFFSADSTFGRARAYPRYGFVGSNSEASYPPPTGRPDGGYFEGDVDELYVYHRALSLAEIRYLADDTPGDGESYIPVPSVANLYNEEPPLSRSVNFKDFTLLADQWLEEQLWPQP